MAADVLMIRIFASGRLISADLRLTYSESSLWLPSSSTTIAAQLRHDDGGTLVRELYGHPDAAIARQRIRAAFRDATPVVALPTTGQGRGAA